MAKAKNKSHSPPLTKSPVIVTKEDIASVVSKLFYTAEDEVLKANSIHDIAHQSLDKVELVCALEDHYQISLSLEEAEHLSTWDSAIAYLQKKVDQACKK